MYYVNGCDFRPGFLPPHSPRQPHCSLFFPPSRFSSFKIASSFFLLAYRVCHPCTLHFGMSACAASARGVRYSLAPSTSQLQPPFFFFLPSVFRLPLLVSPPVLSLALLSLSSIWPQAPMDPPIAHAACSVQRAAWNIIFSHPFVYKWMSIAQAGFFEGVCRGVGLERLLFFTPSVALGIPMRCYLYAQPTSQPSQPASLANQPRPADYLCVTCGHSPAQPRA